MNFTTYKTAEDVGNKFKLLRSTTLQICQLEESIEFYEACGAPVTRQLKFASGGGGKDCTDFLNEAADLQCLLESKRKLQNALKAECCALLAFLPSARDREIMREHFICAKSNDELDRSIREKGYFISPSVRNKTYKKSFEQIVSTIMNLEIAQ